MKRFITAALAVCMMFALCACGEPAAPSGDIAYSVSVLDGQGNPFTDGVVVKFVQGEQQAAMQVVDDNGVAKKTLPAGDYTVELMFTDADASFHYDATNAKVTAEAPELTITLTGAVKGEPRSLYANEKDYQAYEVTEGTTYVDLTVGDMTYFLFVPTRGGTYEISTDAEDTVVGYYGSPFFVLSNSPEPADDNTYTVNVSNDMIGSGETGTAAMVIGVSTQESENCLLSVVRTGDPQVTLADYPWTEYVATHTPEKFTLELAAGEKLTYVDITAATEDYVAVLGEDGFYHLGTADGPVLYMNLGVEAPYISLKLMIQGDGHAGGAPMRHYFYDENGEFVKKEDYTELVISYIESRDENYDVYPVTEDLVYILKNAGSGWWTSDSPDFVMDGCNPELGWMFAFCYIAQ